MPWFLVALVLLTTVLAVLARSDNDRLAVLAMGEAVIVAYFCIALRRSHASAAGRRDPEGAAGDAPRSTHAVGLMSGTKK